jgi:predicted naringenin-chalcone synthase
VANLVKGPAGLKDRNCLRAWTRATEYLMPAQILGIGTAVPEFHVAQADAAQQASQLCCATAQQERMLTVLYLRAGVRKRHSVLLTSSTNGLPAEQSFYSANCNGSAGPTTAERMMAYDRYAAPLAIEAASRALIDAGGQADEITHVVTVSCSGFAAPGVDLALIRELQLRPESSRTHIGFVGCHGALNGLRVAKAFAESTPGACVLLCAVELCSLHHQFHWQPDQIVANALFADGAAAAVVRAGGEGHAETNTRGVLNVVDQRSAVIPDSSAFIQWHVKDHGFEMALSTQVPGLIDRVVRPWLEAWLGEHQLSIDQIGSWAVHPGGPRILEACAAAISSDSNRLIDSETVLSDYGNMSSPTVLFILDRLRQRGAPRPMVALAFGPGIAIEAALLK